MAHENKSVLNTKLHIVAPRNPRNERTQRINALSCRIVIVVTLATGFRLRGVEDATAPFRGGIVGFSVGGFG